MIKKCLNCGEEYEAVRKNQIFCSEKCSHHYIYKRHYKPKKPGAGTMTENGTRICEGCGGEFTPTTSYNKFCSQSCYQRWYRRTHKEKFERTYTLTCISCGKQFESKSMNRMYCSIGCLKKMHSTKDSYIKKCPECGEEFETVERRRIFCSRSCASRASAREQAKRRLTQHKCEYCGEMFTPIGMEPYCSAKCKEELKKYERKCEHCGKIYYSRTEMRYCKLCRMKLMKRRRESQLEKMTREASEVGLSYGKYKTELAQGRTYEEMKAEYEEKKAIQAENESVMWWEAIR